MPKYELNFTGAEVSELLGRVKDLNLDEIKADIETLKTKTITIATLDDFSNDGFMRKAGTINTSSSYGHTAHLYVGDCKTVKINALIKSSSVSPVVWFDTNKNYISGESTTAEQYTVFHTYEFTVPENAEYAVFSCYRDTSKKTYVKVLTTRIVEEEEETSPTIINKVYISANGNDDNDGLSSNSPIATFVKAKKIMNTDGELVMLAGDYHNLAVDLGAFSKITASGNVRLIYYDSIFNSAVLMDGYDRIYKTPCTSTFTTSIWQHDVADSRTEILPEERHVLHRRKTHRLPSTRIRNVSKVDSTSTDLNGFLTTMQNNTEEYLYYTDGTNLYFTAPSSDFTTNPIIKGTANIVTASTSNHVHIRGINVLYAQMKVTGLTGIIEEVSVLGGYAGGCLVWDNARNLTLYRCEACGADNDGINGHGNGDIVCVDCWTHDCLDDGESAHENCRITHYGGLCEYNNSGCTPASGAHGTYYNVISRHITNCGFSAQGVDAVIVCNSCLSVSCLTGFNVGGTAFGTMINCVAKGNKNAFLGSTMQKFNCVAETE